MHYYFVSYIFIKLNEFNIGKVLIGLPPETSKHWVLPHMAGKGRLFTP